MHRTGQITRAITALVALAALLAGVPVALWSLAGSPLPDQMPSLSDITTALARPDDGQLFLRVLAVAGWLTWISFVVAVAVEIPAQLGGRSTVRLPMMGPQQRLAAALVATVTLLAGSPTLASAAATPAYAATAPPAATVAPATSPSPAAADYFVHEVQPGETTASITRLYTGDPAEYAKILGPNTGRVQPDGQALQEGQVTLQPGWLLRIAAAAVTATTAQTTAGPGERTVAVTEPGGLPELVHRHDAANTWQQVYERNRGLSQPGGQALVDPRHLQTGWRIILPANTSAAPLLPVAATAPDTEILYEVERNDWLWYVAERFCGSSKRVGEIEALNPQLEARDARFPDHIEKTWRIRLPADAYDRGPREHAMGRIVAGQLAAEPVAPHAPSPRPAAPSAPAGPSIAPSATTSAAPTPSAASPASPGPSAIPTAPTAPAIPGVTTVPAEPADGATSAPTRAPAASTVDDDESVDDADNSFIDLALPITAALATAGLLAALLLSRLRHRRGRQQQHRRHGRRIAQPISPAAETAARVAARPADVARLDHGLRTLAAGLRGREPADLPDVVAAWLDEGTLHILLARPCSDPPSPYVARRGDMTWTLPTDAELPDIDGHLAPLPALVTIGSHPSGQHLLVDLERAGLLTITGDPDRARDLMRYLAAELATSHWADDVEVVLVGFTAEETEHLIALNEERMRAAVALPDALARARRRAAANIAAIADSGAGDALAGRVNDIIADAWMPHVLLIADPAASIADLADLDTELQEGGRCAVAVAAVAATASTWTARVSPSGQLSIDWLSISDATATRLPADQLARLAPVVHAARTRLATSPADIDLDEACQELDEPVPPAVEDEPWAEGTDAHGHLLPPEPFAAAADVPAGTDVVAEAEIRDPAGGVHPEPERRQAVDESAAEAGRTGVVPEPPADPAVAMAADPGQLQPVVELTGSARRPSQSATVGTARRRRMPTDPDLDGDLRAWYLPDEHRPRIAILGPVSIDAPGQQPQDRRRFYSEIIVYLASRGARGATADQVDEALWPERRISDASRRVAMTRVRRWLGEDADGHLWLPPNMGSSRLYRLGGGYLFDWWLFRRLRTRGEARGAAGAADLRRALELVRGAPLDGAERPYAAGNRNPYTWLAASDIQPHHLASAVVDTAHQLVRLYLDAGDTVNARWAVERAWLADPDRLDDHPWLDLMRIAAEDGRTSELRVMVVELMHARDVEVPEELNPDTYREVDRLVGDLLRVG